jgi:molybdopterin/thiamine biosynthesis adenylyltransferase
MTPDLTQEEVFRYARHVIIPEIGLEGQRKLKHASVLIVGVGGLGSASALYLAAAGVGHIGIVDHDSVDVSNLQRQVIHNTDGIGKLKVESARERMLRLNPHIQVDIYTSVFNADNAEKIAGPYEMIVDGTDNFPARYLLNDLCVQNGKPYVYGSVWRFEGQTSVFDARRGPCYRCLFPEPPHADFTHASSTAGVLCVLPGTIGTIQATEALKLIIGIGAPLIGRILLYDGLAMSFQIVQFSRDPAFVVCGPKSHDV